MAKKPPIVKPLSSAKYKASKAPKSATETVASKSGRVCERAHCGSGSVAFRQGQHVCARHKPAGDPNCTHSLGNPCPYCGYDTEEGE